MKNLKNKSLLTAIIVSSFFLACSKKQVKPCEATTATEVKTENTTFAKKASIKPTLTFFAEQAKINGYNLIEAPVGYVPKKLGEWDYSKVYLYEQGNYKTLELYQFDSAESRQIALDGNTKDLWEDNGKVKCSGPGSLCGDTSGGTPAIALLD